MIPTIVVLPGLDGSLDLRREFIECLSENYPVQAVEYPPDEALDYSETEALVRSRLPTGRPFVLLAESYSGPIAVRVAASRPVGLVGLVLVSTFVTSPRPWLSWTGSQAGLLPSGRAPSFLLTWFLLGRWSSPSRTSALVAAEKRLGTAMRSQRIRDALTVDAALACREVAVPALSIVAADDRVVPRRASEFISGSINGVTQIVVPGPHALLLAVPAEVAAQVRRFVDSVNLASR